MKGIFYLFILVFVFAPKGAGAYIDPGSGSYIFQLLLAGLLGSIFAIKMFWRNIKTKIIKIFLKEKHIKKEDDDRYEST